MWRDYLDRRPIIVALAGSNGAGKTTFYYSHMAGLGLPFVNADEIGIALNVGAYEAADAARALREALVAKRESFVFETVFSDPVGEKVSFLADAVSPGYSVVLIFVKISDSEVSRERVSMRVAQGGHDVPDEKIYSRFGRTEKNLERAIRELPVVLVFDNSDLRMPYQHVETYVDGKLKSG